MEQALSWLGRHETPPARAEVRGQSRGEETTESSGSMNFLELRGTVPEDVDEVPEDRRSGVPRGP